MVVKKSNALTISRTVISLESLEICTLKTCMIPIERPHHTRPWLTKNEIPLSFALYYVTIFVEKFRQNSKERKCLCTFIPYVRNKLSIYSMYKAKLH